MTIPRRELIKGLLTAGPLALLVSRRVRADTNGDDVPFDPERRIIAAPAAPARWPVFRRRLDAWRKTKRRAMNYDGSLYRRADLAWTGSLRHDRFSLRDGSGMMPGRNPRTSVSRRLVLLNAG